MNNSTYFFLGANSCRGFYSLYNEFIAEPGTEYLFILKGGAGCGKSSFMRSIAVALADAGMDVEYISCSGDPDSLDAIYIPEKKTAYVDGTAPHVIEAEYPGVRHSYVNLGIFYDSDALKPHFEEIKHYQVQYKAGYKKAYAALSALGSFESGLFDTLLSDRAFDTIKRRAEGIIAREIKKTGREGSYKLRFLSSLSAKGRECCFSTANKLCSKVYAIDNDYGLSKWLLQPISEAAVSRGYDTIICPDPLRPDEIEHVLIPELSLGFVSAQRKLEPENAFRNIRLNTLIDRDELRANRYDYRSDLNVRDALLEKAIDGLTTAKQNHDYMEKIYNPHVDFGGVYALADAHVKKLSNKV